MNTLEFRAAVQIAESRMDLSQHDDGILYGCAMPDFEPVACSLQVVARFLRWQAMMLNAHWDYEALNECRNILRRKAIITNPPADNSRPMKLAAPGPLRVIVRPLDRV